MTQQKEKGKFYLLNALRNNYENHLLIQELFPVVWAKKMIQNYIAKHKKE
jgi:hypothetical protein